MEQYIPKSALVAEINKLIKKNELYLDDNVSDSVRFQKTGSYSILCDLRHSLDTLEIKEVDLNEEIDRWQGCEAFPEGVGITPLPKAMEIVERTAKHFFELGLRASQPTTSVYGIEEALKENGIDPDSKEADMYREAIYKIYDRLKAQKGE